MPQNKGIKIPFRIYFDILCTGMPTGSHKIKKEELHFVANFDGELPLPVTSFKDTPPPPYCQKLFPWI